MPAPAVPRERLHDILTTHIGLEPEQIDDALSLAELGIDSIGVIELEKVLQDDYGISLPDESQAMTVAEIHAHINAAPGSEN